jgi:hypothetical protein
MSHTVIFRSGKLRQKVEFTSAEITRCPFIRKSLARANDICPNNHHVLPVTIRVTSLSVKTIGNFLRFMKNIPLQQLKEQDVCDLAVMACAFEMEELAEQLLAWKPMQPNTEVTPSIPKQKKQTSKKQVRTTKCETDLIDDGNILLQQLATLNL